MVGEVSRCLTVQAAVHHDGQLVHSALEQKVTRQQDYDADDDEHDCDDTDN